MNRRGIVLSLALIIIAVTVAFLPVLSCDFVNYDDGNMVTENVKIKELSLDSVKEYFTSFHRYLYHPLVLLSYSLEYRFFGLDPLPYHATNLLFHILNCLLVFLLFLVLTNRCMIGLIVALFFGLHPLHVESVAWIAERKDVLYAFFFLGSLVAYAGYAKKEKTGLYVLSVILFLFSLLSKPMAVTLPFVLLLFDYLLRKRFDRKTITDKLPFFILAALFVAVTLIGHFPAESVKKFPSFPILYRPFIAAYGIVFYLAKTFSPVDLSVAYAYPESLKAVIPLLFKLSLLVVFILLGLVLYSARYTRKIIFGAFFFLITIGPVLQLMPVGRDGTPADRFTYIPLIGIFYLFAEEIYWIYNRPWKYQRMAKKLILCILAAVFLVCGVLTWQRCRVWNNSLALWNNVIKQDKNISLAFNNRAIAYFEEKDYPNAILDYTEALRLEPGLIEARNNRGVAHNAVGEYDKAIEDLSRVLEKAPIPDTYMNRAMAYRNKGDLTKAREDEENARKLRTNQGAFFSDIYLKKGNEFFSQGKLKLAVEAYTMALRSYPNNPVAFNNRGLVLMRLGAINEAIGDYSRAIALRPDFADAYHNRGLAFGHAKNFNRALGDLSKTIDIKPDHYTAYFNRAYVYYMTGQYGKAWEDVRVLEESGGKVDPGFIKMLREASGGPPGGKQ
ncbi:tetratricopeptide repeat protein [Candidatus Auribacterota bacterium]